jgi:trimethyllysine dioxygenase
MSITCNNVHIPRENIIVGFKTSPCRKSLTIDFQENKWKFHAQWLHDAQVDNGASKDAVDVFTQKFQVALINDVNLTEQGVRSNLGVSWDDGSTSYFPAVWLKVLAPLVAKPHDNTSARMPDTAKGWLATTLQIPEFSFFNVFPKDVNSKEFSATKELVYDTLLRKSATGIIKVIDLPAPELEEERQKENTLVTRILKQLFGSVFLHPVRGFEKTFNISSHHEDDAKRGAKLPNYNAVKALLPHADHAHYTHPSRIQGLYALEGESENTFVSCHAALNALQLESPELVPYLSAVPMIIGRCAEFYTPPLYQATVDTAITLEPGFPDSIKRFRWHPHLAGSLLASYDTFPEAREAYRKFQEIMRRDEVQVKIRFKQGDLYIWDNFRILHGRERVLATPRTAVGQTVPEQVVVDAYRAIKMGRLKGIVDEKWLVHVPLEQLDEMVELVAKASFPG